jgi:hypothetical protein
MGTTITTPTLTLDLSRIDRVEERLAMAKIYAEKKARVIAYEKANAAQEDAIDALCEATRERHDNEAREMAARHEAELAAIEAKWATDNPAEAAALERLEALISDIDLNDYGDAASEPLLAGWSDHPVFCRLTGLMIFDDDAYFEDNDNYVLTDALPLKKADADE